jgi:RNA polymerase sigma-70 factor (ECF subfamily)
MDVMKRLDDLDADLRDIVLLIAIEDRTTVEVSELLGIPVGTVKSRLHRARRILRGASEDL